MIPQIQTSRFETNVQNIQHAFTIELTPTLAKLLSSQTYTDKVLAAIREPLSNAYDSHVRAGTLDQSVDLHLPTQLEPFFALRDYGTGLSHDDVIRLFFSYGVSDKRETNNEIGGLGIGAKAFFAYVDQATITSYFNGMKRVYSANKGSNGLPQGMVVSVSETDEPNGIALHYPVQPSNIQEFHEKSRRILTHLPLKVQCNVALDIKPVVEFFSATVRGAKVVLPTSNAEPLVVMGGIAYEIPHDVTWNHAQKKYNQIFSGNYIIHLPIGSVEISASRESLSPTDADKDLIVDILEDFRNSLLKENWNKRLEAADSWIQAAKLRGYIYGLLPHGRNELTAVWKGITLNNKFTLADGRSPVYAVYRYSWRSNRYKADVFSGGWTNRKIEKVYWLPADKKIGWQKWYHENGTLSYASGSPIDLIVRTETLAAAQDVLKILGVDLEVIDGTFMKAPATPRTRTNKGSRPSGLAWINGNTTKGFARKLEEFRPEQLIFSKTENSDLFDVFVQAGVLKDHPVAFWPYGMSNDVAVKRFGQYPRTLLEWCQRNKDKVDMDAWRRHAVLHQLYMLWIHDTGRNSRPSGWPQHYRILNNEDMFGFPVKLQLNLHNREPIPLAKLPDPKRVVAEVQKWVDKVFAKYPPTLQREIAKSYGSVSFSDMMKLYNEMTAKKK